MLFTEINSCLRHTCSCLVNFHAFFAVLDYQRGTERKIHGEEVLLKEGLTHLDQGAGLYSQFAYMIFKYSQSFIHQFRGLYRTRIMTSSQLACQLSWQSTASISQRSLVQIPYRPKFFLGPIFATTQEVFITVKIVFIFTFLVLSETKRR